MRKIFWVELSIGNKLLAKLFDTKLFIIQHTCLFNLKYPIQNNLHIQFPHLNFLVLYQLELSILSLMREFQWLRNLTKLMHAFSVMFYKDIENEFEFLLPPQVIELLLYSFLRYYFVSANH